MLIEETLLFWGAMEEEGCHCKHQECPCHDSRFFLLCFWDVSSYGLP
jgi:hypothetical protein